MQSVQEVQEGRPAGETKPRIAKNRGRIDVIADVLNCCRSLSSKSHIMLFANVNSIVATRMITKLAESELLDSVHSDGSVVYVATPKGVAFVAKYLELQKMISPELVPETKTYTASRLNGLTF
jgi:predicted transcriptional regulator